MTSDHGDFSPPQQTSQQQFHLQLMAAMELEAIAMAPAAWTKQLSASCFWDSVAMHGDPCLDILDVVIFNVETCMYWQLQF